MGYRIYREVMRYAPRSLTHREKLTALVLADDANDDTRVTWHSTEDPEIMRMAMVPDERAMRRVVARLREEKVIEHAGGGHNGKVAKFRFLPLGPAAVKPGESDPATGGVGGSEPPAYAEGSDRKDPATGGVAGSSGASSRVDSATPTPPTPHSSSSLPAALAAAVRAAGGGEGEEERDFIEWIKEQAPANKPIKSVAAYLRTVVANGDLPGLVERWRAERDSAPPQRKPLPDWCGQCGIPDGMPESTYRTNENFRYVRTDDGRTTKCTCHPDHPSRKEQT